MADTATLARRAAAFTKLRNRRHKATPIGRVIIDFVLERDMPLAEAAQQLNLTREALWELMSKPRRWARPYTRDALASFLRRPISDIETLLEEIRSEHADAPVVSQLDGLLVRYPDWWFNLRPSNTEPVLRLNVEADNESLMIEKRDALLARIGGS